MWSSSPADHDTVGTHGATKSTRILASPESRKPVNHTIREQLMVRHRKQGRPRTIRRVRISVIPRAEDEIDQHALALALLAFQQQLDAQRVKLNEKQASLKHPTRLSKKL
jgi:hypothetical protein